MECQNTIINRLLQNLLLFTLNIVLLIVPFCLYGTIYENSERPIPINELWVQEDVKYKKLYEKYKSEKDLYAKFDILFNEWRVCEDISDITCSSLSPTPREQFIWYANDEFCKMAFTIMPFVATNCINEPNVEAHHRLWKLITRTEYVKPGENPWEGESEKFLYSGGREMARARTLMLLKEFNLAQKKNHYDDVYKLRMAIDAQGVMAYEAIVDEIRNDNMYASCFIVGVNSDILVPSNERDVILAWWEKNKDRFTMPPQSPDFKGDYGLDKWKRIEN